MSAKNTLIAVFEESSSIRMVYERHFDAKQDILVEDDEEDDDVYLIRARARRRSSSVCGSESFLVKGI